MPPESVATPSPFSKKRFSEIDSLRAIACTLVILFHAGVSSPWLHKVLINTFGIGSVGVTLFFAISGFVIPDSLRGERWKGTKRFALRRFWRLYPPFWIALLLTWWIDARYEAARLPWDAIMLPSFGPFGSGFRHFWTLELELIFYLSIAVLFLVCGRLGWKVLLPGYLLLVILSLRNSLTRESLSHYEMMLVNLAVMFWGGLCREILRIDFSRWCWSAPRHGVSWARASALGLTTGALILVHFTKGIDLGWLVSVLGFLFWVVLTPVRITWLSHIGRWTYSTYLLHNLIITLARSKLSLPIFREISDIPLCFAGLCLLFSFIAGALAYRWIEQPSDRIGKQLTAKVPQLTIG